ncbi:glycosyltransferase [Alteromonas pelagimontana]|uniref:Glycosyltransferase n=1 Tax=Alteromonas pelagimontana TaxID=1858656 RepID=A0A6M4MF90_9ALTE|nr:glycosyltransferase [Alteromonas pelagimontana]QJR81657.1 glycosyltransferase [Alteromonas pelagimontana]
MSSSLSVVTIVKNRIPQLRNLITHLEACDPLPSELVVVWMAPPSQNSLIKSERISIVHKFVNGESLPIAKARNKGISCASNDLIAYLNVDAVCAPNLVTAALEHWQPKSLLTTDVRYLPPSDLEQDYQTLLNAHQADANKGKRDGKPFDDYDCSTLFLISKEDFAKTGGFDERYDGFGLNDEDFFTNCRTLGFTFKPLDLVTFSQERPNYLCPVNHFLDFIRNAEIYRNKWGSYPRDGILREYAHHGYINEDFRDRGIVIQQLPSRSEYSQTFVENVQLVSETSRS